MVLMLIFDIDKGAEGKSIPEGNTEFDEAIRTAERKGIKIAWSNDAFELWILLHFENSLHDTLYALGSMVILLFLAQTTSRYITRPLSKYVGFFYFLYSF